MINSEKPVPRLYIKERRSVPLVYNLGTGFSELIIPPVPEPLP